MSDIRRPKTAVQQLGSFGAADRDLGRLAKRPGSQMSVRSLGPVDESCWPQYVPARRVPSAMRRNMEIQTDANPGGSEPASGAAVFYPYYVPGGLQDPQPAAQPPQPFVLLSPYQLPGYQSLPVLDAGQLQLLDPVMFRQPRDTHPLTGAPIYRSGRNGSCWRHIRQCTGNLGNNIMFIDGHVKEDDCRRFPPHGYPGSSTGGLSVYNRLAPRSQQRVAAGIPLGFPVTRQQSLVHQSQALERAKSGTKYWFEDKKSAPLVPNTIQGRIMKSGAAY